MSGFVMKGALVEFMPTFLPIPLPNVIVFQYNPETMTHTWRQPQPAVSAGTETSNPLAVQGMPSEEFSFTIALDSNEDIAGGSQPGAGLATATGLYSRLAALEMLLYPTGKGGSGLVGAVSAAIQAGLAGDTSGPVRTVPESVMPVTLFIFGPGRIVPVRVTTLTITEKLYDAALNPVHAEAEIGLAVLTPAELVAAKSDHDVLANLATVAYTYTLSLRQALAVANLGNAAQSVVGMIPH
ncbi:MAG TPA: hypothetical protein VMC03_03585 [Streptosporangiaceae bacterium]|nr:hypothetical protein [Streptosporangiaceae bacterium]